MGIFGKSKDEEKKEPKPDFSNVQSGGSSTAPAQKPEKTGIGQKTYTVQSGDSLWKIAERHYGDGNRWRQIFEANQDQIEDPDVIHPGQTLMIPDGGKKGEDR
ncbi:hypothetical protein BH18GEM1_BH18GEM1_12270 [soil metagenome]